jgi:hypothetical protein
MGAPRPRDMDGKPVSASAALRDEFVRRFRGGEASVTRDAAVTSAMADARVEDTEANRKLFERAVSAAVGDLRAKRKLVILQRTGPPIYGPGGAVHKKAAAVPVVTHGTDIEAACSLLRLALEGDSSRAASRVKAALALLEE